MSPIEPARLAEILDKETPHYDSLPRKLIYILDWNRAAFCLRHKGASVAGASQTQKVRERAGKSI